ncbi:MAG: hypothetical protein ABSB10_02230 [Candidatus Bathyarchaeia archaeon]|jgi:hypothetical protein
MKSWQLDRKVKGLSGKLDDSAKTETRLDYNCFSEPERKLLDKVQEIVDEYAPASPPQDVIEKNADLWYKGLEIFGRRTTELFVEIMPASLCCDELEEWYFKIYFYNFLYDWLESVQKVREMPKEKREALILERREMGLLDRVFRLHRSQPETTKNQKITEGKPH